MQECLSACISVYLFTITEVLICLFFHSVSESFTHPLTHSTLLNNLSFFRWQWTGFRCSMHRLCRSLPTTRPWVRVPSCTNRVNAMLSSSGTCPKICLKNACTQTPSLLTIPGTKGCGCTLRFWKLSPISYQQWYWQLWNGYEWEGWLYEIQQNRTSTPPKSDLNSSALWKHFQRLA